MSKRNLVYSFKGIINHCAENVVRLLDAQDENAIRKFQRLDYRANENGVCGPSSEDYADNDFDAYYLTVYGFAYAFEYWVMYDAILRSFDSNQGRIFGVASYGCGSMIDAWSLAYAKAFIQESDQNVLLPRNMYYYGLDLAKWALYFGGVDENDETSEIREHVNSYYRGHPKINEFNEDGMGEYIENAFDIDYDENHDVKVSYYAQNYNVLMFSKILNELPSEVLDEVLENMEVMAQRGGFNNRNEIYICISHNSSGVENHNSDIAERLINAINYNNDFIIDGSIMENSILWNDEGLVLADEDADELHKVYEFSKTDENNDGYRRGKYIIDYNYDFTFSRIPYIRIIDRLNENELKHVMTRTTHFAMQVVKLTRRDDQ